MLAACRSTLGQQRLRKAATSSSQTLFPISWSALYHFVIAVWRVKRKIMARGSVSFLQVNESEAQAEIFLRSVLRSGKILMRNRATLRNALRKRNYELPSVSNDMQSSETLRNSLGLNYKSAALDQLSYAGVSPYESCFQRVDQEFVMNHFAHRAAKAIKISRNFSTAREMTRTRGGPGSSRSTRSNV